LFRRFLVAYIDVCNNIVTEAANSVLMFEAGEQAAATLTFDNIEDCFREFEKDYIKITVERSEKKVLFKVKGLGIHKKCKYCDLLRGFFGELARKHIDSKYHCKKATQCSIEGAQECIFIAEMVE
jgi:predicted hydrocarbon binding protein